MLPFSFAAILRGKICLLTFFLFFTVPLFAQTIPAAESVAANNTAVTAMPVTSPLKLRGSLFPAGDVDFYSFTANAGDKVFAAVMTSFSAGSSTDSQLSLYASDGTTLIEFDDDNGTFAGLSSSIAGAVIPASGTYYIKVNDFTAGTTSERGYDLYLRVQSGTPTAETEPNDGTATATPMPASGFVSGAKTTTTDVDFYAITLAAGESVYISMDLDPERNGVTWNGRLGFALFGDAGNQILVADDAGAAETPNPTEGLFVTVKDAGTYYVYVDAAAAIGDPTFTYNLSVTRYAATTGYVNYPSADIPKTIGPGAGSVSSVITIPDNKVIKDISVRVNLTHALMADVDAILTTPGGDRIALFTDIGAVAVGGQTQMDLFFNDNNATPPAFTILKGLGFTPELSSKLDVFRGVKSQGTWTLTLYDDGANTSGGTLNGWSIDILEDQSPTTGTIIASEDFEVTDGGFTHSGTADEWEYGTPATPATITANPVAPFTTANSGTKCWKTDLDNTYDINSNQVLMSPVYNLTTISGPLFMSWAMKYQVENASFDFLTVTAEEEPGGSGLVQTLFTWLGPTPSVAVGNPVTNIGMSGGWGTFTADVSAFAGKQFRFKVRLQSDNTVNFAGVAIDDVRLIQQAVVAASQNHLQGSKAAGGNKLHWTAGAGGDPSATVSLERSADGLSFQAIHSETVLAERTAFPFDYTDNTPLAGKNYYRVKITTSAGRTAYTNIVLLLSGDKGLQVMNVAPNPVRGGSFILNLSSASNKQVQVIITDAQGKIVRTQTFAANAGFNALQMYSDDLAAGSYYLYALSADERSAPIGFIKK